MMTGMTSEATQQATDNHPTLSRARAVLSRFMSLGDGLTSMSRLVATMGAPWRAASRATPRGVNE